MSDLAMPVSRAKPLFILILVVLLAVAFWITFVIPPGKSASLDQWGGKQLELPFEHIEPSRKVEPEKPVDVPKVRNKRYDEERLGTCIVYALVAPFDGEYLIPGCYGKPDAWEFVEKRKILKVGRHWNPSLMGCKNTGKLASTVRNKRYGNDKKFPKGFISIKVNGVVTDLGMHIAVLDCVENVPENACEAIEKQYIQMHGGSNNLLLNCCCR